MHASDALLELHRIPRKVVVDDGPAKLEIAALAADLRRHQDVRVFCEMLIQKSILDLFLVCLALCLISKIGSRADAQTAADHPWTSLGLGAALGALSLTRENALALVVVVAVWVTVTEWTTLSPTRTRGMRMRGPLALLLGLAIVLLPVVARNLFVGGGFYLTTAQLGPNLYIGNNPRANGTYTALREGREDAAFERQDATELAQRALGRALAPGEVSAFWRDRALDDITSAPRDWLALLGRKLMLLVSATEIIDTEAQESHAEWSTSLRWASSIGHFGILLPLALVGIVTTWADRKRLRIIYLTALVYAASVLLFFVVARYRYPLIPFLVLFAAAGIARVPDFARQATRRRQVALAVAVMAMAVLTQTPAFSAETMRAITDTNLGVALQAQGRLDQAIAHYRRAIAISPDYAPAYNNLGVALRSQGKLDEVIPAYRQALERRPDYPEVHYNLATALIEQGKPQEALTHFRMAREALPSTAAAHNNFGVALAAAGFRDDAIDEFRAALALEPDSSETLRNLGDALARQRRYPEAVDCFRRIVELDAGNPAGHYDLGNVLMEAGRLSEAAGQFRATIALAPDAPQAHKNLGVALAAMGQIDEAIPEFRQALTLSPDDADAQRYLTMALKARR